MIFVAGILLCLAASAQENRYWYFGKRAVLDFFPPTQTAPVTMSGNAMNADEASASICDQTGQLLFYTNGDTVYNRLHQAMLNGGRIGGHTSACQVQIVPQPGNDSLYYIFTTGAVESNYAEGYRYSIVNIKRDAGNGEVITKGTLLSASCTERLTAARHNNGVDFWIITNDNNSNIFRAYLLNCNGLQAANPVVSTIGAVLNQPVFVNTGVMKVSPDGTQLVQTHFPSWDEINHPPNFVQLFDFNNTTGVISNTRTINYPNAQYTHAEFSPNSQYLYLTRPYDQSFGGSTIDQLEAKLATNAAILASRYSFPTNGYYYDIQLAPDAKIYLSRPSSFLSVLNNPDSKGAMAALQENAIPLMPGSTFVGLPSSINDINAGGSSSFSHTIIDSCNGTVQFNANSNLPGNITYEWDFGDGNTSSQQNPLHSFNPIDQSYTIKLTVRSDLSCGAVFRTRVVRPTGIITDAKFDYVVRCDSGYVRFINQTAALQNNGGYFTWDFGDNQFSADVHPIHTYAGAGSYDVKLKFNTNTACIDDSVMHTVVIRTPAITMSPSQTIMPGTSVMISATSATAVNYTWTPAESLSNPNIRTPLASPLQDTWYKVTASGSDGCSITDSVLIKVIPINDFYIPSGFTPNNDGLNDDIKPIFGGQFLLEQFSIFDRWGNRVFSTKKRGHAWNGKLNGTDAASGVYVWILQAKDSQGNSYTRKGTIVLIR